MFKRILSWLTLNLFYLLGLAVFLFGVVLSQMWRAYDKDSEYFDPSMNDVFIAYAIGLACCILGVYIIKFGRRLSTAPLKEKITNEEVESIAKNPETIIYLRSFNADKLLNKGISSGGKYLMPYLFWLDLESMERDIAAFFSAYGNIWGIEKPGRTLSYRGIPKLSLSHSAWQPFISTAIQHCKLIVIISGDSKGLEWELEEVYKLKQTEKLILASVAQNDNPALVRKMLELHHQYFPEFHLYLKGFNSICYYKGSELKDTYFGDFETDMKRVLREKGCKEISRN